MTLRLQQFIAILPKRNYGNYTGDLVILPLNVFAAYSPELDTRILTNPLWPKSANIATNVKYMAAPPVAFVLRFGTM
jgi:hypothetical protein